MKTHSRAQVAYNKMNKQQTNKPRQNPLPPFLMCRLRGKKTLLLSKSSHEDVDKDVLLPNVKIRLSTLICSATKMNLLHGFPW